MLLLLVYRFGWGSKKNLGCQLLTKSLNLCLRIAFDCLQSKTFLKYDYLQDKDPITSTVTIIAT